MALGKSGICDLVRGHCQSARLVADEIAKIPGLELSGTVELNQIVLTATYGDYDADHTTQLLAEELNSNHPVFVKTARWKDRNVIRLSLISNGTDGCHAKALASAIGEAWAKVCDDLKSKL